MKKQIMLVFSLLVINLSAEVEKIFARATNYHKTERGCDSDTKKGITSTQIRLRDNCDRTIGMVAVDPQRIPYGSLIYSPSNKRFYLACDVGGDVLERTAAKKLAKKKGLSDDFFNALVLDFYAKKEIVNNHFDYFFVIEHDGENFKSSMTKKEQEIRLDPNFWIRRIKKIKEDKLIDLNYFKEIVDQLKKMSPNTC
jgi:3D (Asp-Asp-Asp) domain-containing protein